MADLKELPVYLFTGFLESGKTKFAVRNEVAAHSLTFKAASLYSAVLNALRKQHY